MSPLPPGASPPPGDPEESYRRSYEGVRDFLRVFDQMRVRPTWRNGDVPLPVLWVAGRYTATAAVAQELEARCDGTPFAHLGPSPDPAEGPLPAGNRHAPPYAAVVAWLRQATRDLAAVAPPGEAHLRFPLLAQVLWLLDLQIDEVEPDRLHDGVKRAVRQRRRQIGGGTAQDRRNFWANVRAYAEGPLPAWAAAAALLSAGWADQLSTLLGVCAILAGLVIGAVHVLLLSRSWAGRRRYGWFCRQPYLIPGERRNQPTDFTRFAVRVLQARRRATAVPAAEVAAVWAAAATRPPADPPAPAPLSIVEGVPEAPEESAEDRKVPEAAQAAEGIEHLLVNAFLEDLRQGYERRPWKVWRRVAWARTSYPVLLADGGAGHLVARVEEVRAGTCLPDPLLVVLAGPAERPPAFPRPGGAGGDAAGAVVPAGRPEQAERLWRRWRGDLARDRAIGSARVLRVDMRPQDAPLFETVTVPVRGRRRPLLAHPVLPWLAVAAVVTLSLVNVVATAASNCGPDIRRAATGECVGLGEDGFVYAPQLARVLGAIDENNEAVLSSGRPYATVVYFGKLTVQGEARIGLTDPLTDIHGELAGITMAQDRLIANSGDGSKLQMRVLVANAGADFRYAEQVAGDVLRQARRDPSVVGVVGLGESRPQVQKAIQLLGRTALPVITTTATFDDLGRRGDAFIPSFFPLAPPNSELAATAARWARAGLPGREVPPARTAVVFADTSVADLLGRDLGARFARAFGDGARTVGYANAAELETRVGEVCSAQGGGEPDLAYYAGRSAQFGAFIDAISKSQCHRLTVLANDDVTQYVNDHAPQLGANNRVRVMYVALASPNAWEAVPRQFRTDFYQRFDAFLASLGMKGLPAIELPSREYAVQARDAAETLMQAAQAAYTGQGGPAAPPGDPGVVDRGGVLLALEKLEEIDGDSGLVKLHGAGDGAHALDRPVLLVAVDPDGRQVVVRQCGRLYAQQPPSPTCGRP
ncbi:hypothetical protein [Sphaerisporangium sp. TRM90804]|uniref:hypothetical protein n=1 Tax=Sphaerisporangium sp. TRM90804 TaxID=3031113 RepID=UPI00244918A2|nr:hypothetical protein [Sphaerisporangium sp. TRM90804]MDH2424653.1 hypothetical protein [Sphaerisporangium sp. TRM90804]